MEHLLRLGRAAAGSEVIPVRWRAGLLRRLGFAVGARPELHPGAHLGSIGIRFGDDVFVNYGLFYDGDATAVVGDRVALGPGVRLITAGHDIGGRSRRCGRSWSAPIHLEAGCWLGADVTVLPGVTVARGCVVGAGAVVTASTEPDGLYVGVPARRVRDLVSGEPELPATPEEPAQYTPDSRQPSTAWR